MMLLLPVDVVCECVLPHLSVRDLQALDTAYTNKLHRTQLRQLWPQYVFDSTVGIGVYMVEVQWLHNIGVSIVGISLLCDKSSSLCHIQSLQHLAICKQYNLCCGNCSKYINDDWLCQLAHGCPQLNALHLAKGDYSDVGITALAQHCPLLEVLRLPYGDYSDIGVTALAQHCHQLHIIALHSDNITNTGNQALCDYCPHLQHIDISFCTQLTDASLMALSRSCPQLQSINMVGCQFTDDALIFFADKCHELRSVSAGGWGNNFTSRGLDALWEANPNITEIVFRSLNISDDDILFLLECCPLLHSLSFELYDAITDAAVIAVAEHCPQLRSLKLHICKNISDVALVAIGQHCHALTSINMSAMRLITDVGMSALAAGCPLLQEVSLFEINISDAGFLALASCCKDLRKFSLSRFFRDVCNGITALVQNCPLLSELTLLYCDNMDDACVHAIAQHCHNLSILDIRAHEFGDVASFVEVATACSNLKKLCVPLKFAEDVKKKCSRIIMEEDQDIWLNLFMY